jgi:hypothetical protein
MEKETSTGIRVGTEWAVGVGAMIALISGAGVLAKLAIVSLSIAGSIGFTAAVLEHKWLSSWWRALAILVVIWGSMAVFGWKAWPHELKTVTIEWQQPSPILESTPLSEKQLNAKALADGKEVAGNYVYFPTYKATLSTGTQTLSVTFTPDDQDRYRSATKTVALVVNPEAKPVPPHVSAKPENAVRITGFVFDPFTIGAPLQLRVYFTNDHDKTVNVKGYFCGATADNLPDPKDTARVLELENQIWQCVVKTSFEQNAIPNAAPPKANVSIPDLIKENGVTQDFLDKINANAGVYVAGILRDASGRFVDVPYCVLLDKNRIGQLPTMCHTHN